ncbi:MAG: YbaB/EbfC family nucleoid-associated protein [Deltaproteobacteria bacterium]|nr:YbaB/EbfC family nucleoid-associated protein [Deltaproteobacteria bacterium]
MTENDLTKTKSLVDQARALQARITEIVKDSDAMEVKATSGGGVVQVTANGRLQIVSMKIDRQIVNPDDIEMLADLIIAATNQAMAAAQAMISEELAKISEDIIKPDKY